MEQYKINLLKLVALYDLRSFIEWNTDLNFFVACSDLFYWGFADVEYISSQEDVDLLEQSIKDILVMNGSRDFFGMELYCARKRKLRPQGACYESIDKNLWPLFDACGPVREVAMSNPKPHPANSSEETTRI